jgi:WD40 repeat protein
VAVGSQEGLLHFYTYETSSTLLESFTAHTASIECLKVSSDQDLILSGSADSTISIWKVMIGAVDSIGSYAGHTASVKSLEFFYANIYVISSSLDNTIHVWHINSRDAVNIIQTNLYGPAWSLKMITPWYLASGHSNGSIVIWNNLLYDGGFNLYTLNSHTNVVFDLELIESRQMLASASWDSTIALWNLNNFTLIHVLLGHTNKIMALLPITYGYNVSALLSASIDNAFIVWNLYNHNITKQVFNENIAIYRAIDRFNDNILLTGSQVDQTVRAWNLPTLSLNGFSQYIAINITTLVVATRECFYF